LRVATGFLAETSCYASEEHPSRITRRVAGPHTAWEVVKASLPHIMSCVPTRFCTKTPRRFSRAEATRYAAEMCIRLCVHRRMETTICCLCRHDILCVRALFGFLLAIKDLTVLWRQQLCRANDVNTDNQHLGYAWSFSLLFRTLFYSATQDGTSARKIPCQRRRYIPDL